LKEYSWLLNSLLWRYRQVPTFGRGVICKFSNNTSGMKCLAAQDFEDLLQVRHYGISNFGTHDNHFSVQYLSLNICYLCPSTPLSWISFSNSQHGTLLQSYVFTLNVHSTTLTRLQLASVGSYTNFLMKQRRFIWRRNSLLKRQRMVADMLQKLPRQQQVLFPPETRPPPQTWIQRERRSRTKWNCAILTSQHTSYMHSVTMYNQFVSSGPLTITWHKW